MNIEKLKERSRIIRLIRQWFEENGFLEMHTPRMVGLPGQEPYLEPFWTVVHRSTSDVDGPSPDDGKSYDAALITSPEYSMKKLLGAGMDKIYDLGPCFRNNEPWDGSHDPEFLMLEWYRRNSELEVLMEDTESLVRYVAQGLTLNPEPLTLNASSFKIPASRFRRLTVEQAWKQFAGVELAPLLGDRAAMAELCSARFSQSVSPDDDWDDLYFKIFLSHIEPELGKEPTFLYRYPASMAALARKSKDDPRWADRVEFYMGDLELANGFAELSDPAEQRQRFVEEQNLRKSKGGKVWDIDEDFIKALPGMGNAAGIAFGVERLVMLLTGSKSINDILPFSAKERFGRR